MFCVGRTGSVPYVLSKSKQVIERDSITGGVFGMEWRKVKRAYTVRNWKKVIYWSFLVA